MAAGASREEGGARSKAGRSTGGEGSEGLGVAEEQRVRGRAKHTSKRHSHDTAEMQKNTDNEEDEEEVRPMTILLGAKYLF